MKPIVATRDLLQIIPLPYRVREHRPGVVPLVNVAKAKKILAPSREIGRIGGTIDPARGTRFVPVRRGLHVSGEGNVVHRTRGVVKDEPDRRCVARSRAATDDVVLALEIQNRELVGMQEPARDEASIVADRSIETRQIVVPDELVVDDLRSVVPRVKRRRSLRPSWSPWSLPLKPPCWLPVQVPWQVRWPFACRILLQLPFRGRHRHADMPRRQGLPAPT